MTFWGGCNTSVAPHPSPPSASVEGVQHICGTPIGLGRRGRGATHLWHPHRPRSRGEGWDGEGGVPWAIPPSASQLGCLAAYMAVHGGVHKGALVQGVRLGIGLDWGRRRKHPPPPGGGSCRAPRACGGERTYVPPLPRIQALVHAPHKDFYC